MMDRNLVADLGIGGDNGGTIQGVGIGQNAQIYSNPASYFTLQLSRIIGFITLIGAVFFVIYLILAGFEWLQAGGDTGKVEKAKGRMINGAVGLLVMILATAIAGVIGGVFGLDILNPQNVFNNL